MHACYIRNKQKIAFRYFISLSVPVLLVRGIIEIAVCVTYINIIGGIIGVVVAGVLAFLFQNSRFMYSKQLV